MRDYIGILTLGALGVLSIVVCLTFSAITKLDAGLAAAVIRNQNKDKDMQTITEEVTRPSGRKVIVATTRNEGESLKDWIARHDAAVAGLLQ
jgi:hypothetical protein